MKTLYTSIYALTTGLLLSTAAFAQPCNTSQPRPITGEQTPCPGTYQTYCIENDRGYTSFVWEEPRAHAGNPPTGWVIVDGQGTSCVTMLVGTKPGTVKVTVVDPECGTKVATLPVHPGRAFEVSLAGPDSVCFDQEQTYTAAVTATSNGNLGSFSYSWTVPADWTITSGQGTASINVIPGTTSGSVSVIATTTATGNGNNGNGVGGRGFCNTNDTASQPVVISDDCGPITPFPVEMIAFEAARAQASVLLTWSTAQELNNERFDIERSTDGREFTRVASVRGNGTTQSRSDYRFTDNSASKAVSYYRLKQVDRDGKFEYSAVRSVKAANLSASEPVQAFPNPTAATINIQLPSEVASDAVVRISTITGQVVYSGTAAQLNGSNNTIDMSRFKSGVYILNVNSGNENQSLRITKL